MYLLRALKGVVSLFLYGLSLMLLAVLTLTSFLLSYLIPMPSWRRAAQLFYMQRFPIWFMSFNFWIAQIATRKKWAILGSGALHQNNWYLMISNHRSWIDIVVLCVAFRRKISPLKFFMKKELLWQLPLAGMACYALGYPFMSRHSYADIRNNPRLKGKDIETTKAACQRLKNFSPITLINFLEGTRFTEKKRAHQQSPFQHLLKPRAGGVAIVLNEMQDVLSGVISVVIDYAGKPPSFWDFASGNINTITVRYDYIPLTPDLMGDYENDRLYRTHLQQWLNALWQKNDEVIARLQN